MGFHHPYLTLGKPKTNTFYLPNFLNNMPYFTKNTLFNKIRCKNYTIDNFTER